MRALSIDDAYVIKMAETVSRSLDQAFLLPSCTDKNREEIQQVVALVMLAEMRFRRMQLMSPEARAAVVRTALEIMADQSEVATMMVEGGVQAPAGEPEDLCAFCEAPVNNGKTHGEGHCFERGH